ncbi:energy-coupling factor transporter transmembrane component T [Desulfosporosinus sp. FKB]|uniref:energy-coupling factor transporter transmembrane component T family protein n=1 Tax=Desulfosporosinus sp. FKB TaxID=1969835 RepID=UPI000B4A3921|nr:energy-coupling factor transporter transmembrane component T [Desulfosporosinus sp. FKB]
MTLALPKFDPRTKLVWYILMIYFALLSQTAAQLGITLLVCITSSLILSGSFKHSKAMVIILLLLGLQILIIQLLFCREGTLIYQWGIIKIYSDSLPLAITGILKATLIFYASLQFFTSASAQDFTLMLVKFEIPYRFAMLVGLAVRFLPLMKEEYQSIIDSQRTRGLKMDSVWDDLKAIIPTFLPFLYRAVRRSTEIALAMELRGYGRSKNRTFSSDIALKSYDVVIIVAMFLVISLSITTRLLPLI